MCGVVLRSAPDKLHAIPRRNHHTPGARDLALHGRKGAPCHADRRANRNGEKLIARRTAASLGGQAPLYTKRLNTSVPSTAQRRPPRAEPPRNHTHSSAPSRHGKLAASKGPRRRPACAPNRCRARAPKCYRRNTLPREVRRTPAALRTRSRAPTVAPKRAIRWAITGHAAGPSADPSTISRATVSARGDPKRRHNKLNDPFPVGEDQSHPRLRRQNFFQGIDAGKVSLCIDE